MTDIHTIAREQVESVLRANGLTDDPGTHDSDIHSWRCSYRDMYGPCDCFQELRDELVAITRRLVDAIEDLADGFGDAGHIKVANDLTTTLANALKGDQ